MVVYDGTIPHDNINFPFPHAIYLFTVHVVQYKNSLRRNRYPLSSLRGASL